MTTFNPADLLPLEEVARRLHVDVAWVREKVRRRCPNPMPVYNLGRHLLLGLDPELLAGTTGLEPAASAVTVVSLIGLDEPIHICWLCSRK